MNELVWIDGYDSNANQILNIYPPFWQVAYTNEINEKNLYECYVKCLLTCKKMGMTHSISFPLIGSGAFAFPIRMSYRLLMTAIDDIDVSMFEEIRIVFHTQEQYDDCINWV